MVLGKHLKTKHPKALLMVVFQRSLMYLNFPAKLAIFAIFFDTHEFNFYYVLGAIGFILWMMYDILRILPQQQDYNITRGVEFVSLRDDVKKILKLLENRND
jgi:hypothetical protein